MKVHILANHYLVASGRYAARAFTRLGHTVSSEGPERGNAIWGLHIPGVAPWTNAKADGAPDLVVVMDSDPAILDASQRYSDVAPVVVWGVDNHVRDYGRPWIKRYYLAHRRVSLTAWDDTSMVQLPCAYDDAAFTPSPIPFDRRAYDVCMIGVMYPERWRLVQQLRAAGLRVLAGTGLVYEAYRDAYHNSRVSLCISACGDVAQRIYETAAMGCAVVTDKCADFDILKPVSFYAYDYPAPRQLIPLAEQITAYLEHPHKARMNAELSQSWAAPHTWVSRAQALINDWRSRG